MYAVLVAVAIDPDHKDEAEKQLQDQVVPGVKQLPGAVSGVWLAPKDGQGYSTIVFESEDQAKAAAETVGARAPQYVTIQHVEVREVSANF
jgi:hypothetical protein